jgi:hypothetical protein
MQERVVKEINAMVREDGGTEEATPEQIFKLRTSAAKRVFLGLSLVEQQMIMKKIEEGGDIVPVDVKQRYVNLFSQDIVLHRYSDPRHQDAQLRWQAKSLRRPLGKTGINWECSR